MGKVTNLQVYAAQGKFIYEVGKPTLQHDGQEVKSIEYHPTRTTEMGEIEDHPCFRVILKDDSEVFWNVHQISGHRATIAKEG